MSQPDRRRVNFLIPNDLYKEIKKFKTSTKTTQSDFFREAAKSYIEKIKKEKLIQELVEGYKAKAELNLKICEEFKYVDGEGS
jgi:metal-responsive CopG/Arc/MetJ family transcriptional regulator